ncbi:MAG: transglutaminase domain-containing protein [Clostridia bacterium]|nr:transglutaminase domain-containing protein [Clostridia bacterium]MDY5555470.1 transglutaminase domain-containing protein [Blautia sp.]
MKKKRFPAGRAAIVAIFIILLIAGGYEVRHRLLPETKQSQSASENSQSDEDNILGRIQDAVSGEPAAVKELRKKEPAASDNGHLEYYFQLLNENEKRGYREILDGIRNFEEQFYLSISGDGQIDRVYHAVLKDHPEIFWVHNREKVYKTTYEGKDYCQFSPGYMYTQEERTQIENAMENAFLEVKNQIPPNADDYQKVMTVYTYIIDNTDYVVGNDDQSIAGVFWKKKAVCAGYAGAVQYLLERLGVYCIYVDGDARNSTEGHAWNIVKLDGQYYYVDATNGDQPDFLEGDAVQLVEHKTIIYDYLCPFPEEYQSVYHASDEFQVPGCTATNKNFYVQNGACFDSYDWDQVYDLSMLRIDNNAAVVRFKFGTREAFNMAYKDCIENGRIQEIARYYMEVHGLTRISYHYGILDNMKTMYFMF